MPDKLDPQAAYEELRRRGVFKNNPRAAAAAQELVKRGVLRDVSGGSTYEQPRPAPTSTPRTVRPASVVNLSGPNSLGVDLGIGSPSPGVDISRAGNAMGGSLTPSLAANAPVGRRKRKATASASSSRVVPTPTPAPAPPRSPSPSIPRKLGTPTATPPQAQPAKNKPLLRRITDSVKFVSDALTNQVKSVSEENKRVNEQYAAAKKNGTLNQLLAQEDRARGEGIKALGEDILTGVSGLLERPLIQAEYNAGKIINDDAAGLAAMALPGIGNMIPGLRVLGRATGVGDTLIKRSGDLAAHRGGAWIEPSTKESRDHQKAVGAFTQGFAANAAPNIASAPVFEAAVGAGSRLGKASGLPGGELLGGLGGLILAGTTAGPVIQAASDAVDPYLYGAENNKLLKQREKQAQQENELLYRLGGIASQGLTQKPTNFAAPLYASSPGTSLAAARALGQEALKGAALSAGTNIANQSIEQLHRTGRINPADINVGDVALDALSGTIFGGDATEIGKPGEMLARQAVSSLPDSPGQLAAIGAMLPRPTPRLTPSERLTLENAATRPVMRTAADLAPNPPLSITEAVAGRRPGREKRYNEVPQQESVQLDASNTRFNRLSTVDNTNNNNPRLLPVDEIRRGERNRVDRPTGRNNNAGETATADSAKLRDETVSVTKVDDTNLVDPSPYAIETEDAASVAPATPDTSPRKEPWQMLRDEYVKPLTANEQERLSYYRDRGDMREVKAIERPRQKAIEEYNAVVRRAVETKQPVPENVVNQFPELRHQWERYNIDPNKKRKVAIDAPVGTRLHGTSRAFADDRVIHPSELEQHQNLLGPGFYTTDSAEAILGNDATPGYIRKGGGWTPAVYKVEWTGDKPPRLLDMDKPLPADAAKIFQNRGIEITPSDTGLEVYGKLRDELAADADKKTYDADEDLKDVADALHKMGYDGFKHTGGINSKVAPHNVEIYFHPIEPSYRANAGKQNVRLTKVSRWADEAAPIPQTQEAPGGSDPYTRIIRNRDDLAAAFKDKNLNLGYDDVEADAVADQYNAVASEWAQRNNAKPEDWYKRFFPGATANAEVIAKQLESEFSQPGKEVKLEGRQAAVYNANRYDSAGGVIWDKTQRNPQDLRRVLVTLQSADKSSAVHELGHYFRQTIKGTHDGELLNRWVGADSHEWTPKQEEKFALAVERYMRDGRTPEPANGVSATGIIGVVRGFLRQVYRTVNDIGRGTGIKAEAFSPEVREMMDSWFGEKKAITGDTIGKNEQPGTQPNTDGTSAEGNRTVRGSGRSSGTGSAADEGAGVSGADRPAVDAGTANAGVLPEDAGVPADTTGGVRRATQPVRESAAPAQSATNTTESTVQVAPEKVDEEFIRQVREQRPQGGLSSGEKYPVTVNINGTKQRYLAHTTKGNYARGVGYQNKTILESLHRGSSGIEFIRRFEIDTKNRLKPLDTYFKESTANNNGDQKVRLTIPDAQFDRFIAEVSQKFTASQSVVDSGSPAPRENTAATPAAKQDPAISAGGGSSNSQQDNDKNTGTKNPAGATTSPEPTRGRSLPNGDGIAGQGARSRSKLEPRADTPTVEEEARRVVRNLAIKSGKPVPEETRNLITRAVEAGRKRKNTADETWQKYVLESYNEKTGDAVIVSPREDRRGEKEVYNVNVKTGKSTDPDSMTWLNGIGGKTLRGDKPILKDGINTELEKAGVTDYRVVSKHVHIARNLIETQGKAKPDLPSDILFQGRAKPKVFNPEKPFEGLSITEQEMYDAAVQEKDWKDWYDRYQNTLGEIFGEDTELFKNLLSATSQAASVPSNVGLAIKAYDQLRNGEEFKGYLPAVIKNLERIRDNEQLAGQKIGQYGKANEGEEDAIAVDRHIAELLFGTKQPTAEQVAHAKAALLATANKLGWRGREVQAALWAFNQTRKGGVPASYDTYLVKKADQIQRIRAAFPEGARGSVSPSSRVDQGSQGYDTGTTPANNQRSAKVLVDPNNPDILFQGTDPNAPDYDPFEDIPAAQPTTRRRTAPAPTGATQQARVEQIVRSQYDTQGRPLPAGDSRRFQQRQAVVNSSEGPFSRNAARFPVHATDAGRKPVTPKLTPAQKVGKLANRSAQFLHANKAFGDLGLISRQGGILSVNHPKGAAKATGALFKSLIPTNRAENFEQIYQGIKEDPDYASAEKDGLYLSHIATERAKGGDEKYRAEEEVFAGNLADILAEHGGKVPGVGGALQSVGRGGQAIENANKAYLDTLRFYAYKQLKQSVVDAARSAAADVRAKKPGAKAVDVDAETAQIARAINYWSGRGDLSRVPGLNKNEQLTKEVIEPLLRTAFFSPKYMASRFQIVTDPSFYSNSTPISRKLVWGQNLRWAASVATVMGIAAASGAQVELDPDKPDFGQVKVGNTRYDLSSGVRRHLRFVLQTAKAVATGRAERIPDLTGRYLRGSAAPVPGLVSDTLFPKFAPDRFDDPIAKRLANEYQSKDVSSKDRTALAGRRVVDLAKPIIYNDIKELFTGKDAPTGQRIVNFGLTATGTGANTYTNKK